MSTIKEATIKTIEKLPDECSIEDIMYEINFVAKVMEGLQDADKGRTISTDELLAKVEQWQK